MLRRRRRNRRTLWRWLATLHANDPLAALHRLDRLAQRANAGPQDQLVGDAIHLVVMIAGGSAGRRVTEIARVDGFADGRAWHCWARAGTGGSDLPWNHPL